MGLQYEVRDGRFHFRCEEHGIFLQDLRPAARYLAGGRSESYRPALPGTTDKILCEPNGDGLQFEFSLAQQRDFAVIHGKLRNLGTASVRMYEVAPLWLPDFGRVAVRGPTREWMIYRNGYQSWTGTRSFAATDIDPAPCFSFVQISVLDPQHLPRQRPGEFRSEIFTAIQHRPTGCTLLAGFLDARTVFPAIEIAVNANHCTQWRAAVDYEGVRLEPGAELILPPLALGCGSDPFALLCAYAELSGQTMEARLAAEKPHGWCSWYYYFTNVDEGAVLENLEHAQQLRGLLRLDYVQIDDGYQADVGDWLDTNSKFPHGMQYLAERIHRAGYGAGIWLAPFLARSTSRLAREHPEWLVKDEEGRPVLALRNPLWGWRACYAVDCTHPDVLEWLQRTIATLTQKWGFDLLKLDFLYAGALPGHRYRKDVTRAAALRIGLEAIRRAAPDTFLIGCGCPFGPAVGLVDSMRIGPDVAPYWSDTISRVILRDLHGVATKHAVRNILSRAFLHRRWWINDPDCLMVRTQSTRLSEEEFRTLATAIALTGGSVVLSDRLALFAQPEVERLRQTLELATDSSATFVDVMCGDFPDILVQSSAEQFSIAIFNPMDTAATKHVDLLRYAPHARSLTHVPEFWTGAILPVRNGVVELGLMPPHSVRVLTVPPV